MFPDSFIIEFDKIVRAVLAPSSPTASSTAREYPGSREVEVALSVADRSHAAALMRVNHVGEICAQGLYHGQAITCRSSETRSALTRAAVEEAEHLRWTERRVMELGSRTSFLLPFWYAGSLAIGAGVGLLGDAWSLGFIAEAERQVEGHLQGHLSALPAQDAKSRAVVLQMKTDEHAHAQMAKSLGGRDLPRASAGVMRVVAQIMVKTAYYV